ncbi:MAG: glycerol-3-phosphate acyltransferase [Eubacteriales bacterium]|nr:glycerol-3-phosphate acyltransferase [Eubacteriales bacterium]
MLQCLFFCCVGFLCGSVLFSYHLPKWIRHVDVVALSRDHNPGTVNAIHFAGVPVGLLCLLLDMLKGFVPVAVAVRVMGPMNPLLSLVLLAPPLGHALAPWYGFHGGKAIATAFGVLAGLLPFSLAGFVLAFWYIFFSVILVIRPNERRTVVTFGCFSLTCLLGALRTGRIFLALGCCLLSCVPIHKNFADLRRMERQAAPEGADSSPQHS